MKAMIYYSCRCVSYMRSSSSYQVVEKHVVTGRRRPCTEGGRDGPAGPLGADSLLRPAPPLGRRGISRRGCSAGCTATPIKCRYCNLEQRQGRQGASLDLELLTCNERSPTSPTNNRCCLCSSSSWSRGTRSVALALRATLGGCRRRPPPPRPRQRPRCSRVRGPRGPCQARPPPSASSESWASQSSAPRRGSPGPARPASAACPRRAGAPTRWARGGVCRGRRGLGLGSVVAVSIRRTLHDKEITGPKSNHSLRGECLRGKAVAGEGQTTRLK